METNEKYVVLCGAMLINTVLGMALYFGNFSTYIYSLHYIRHPPGSWDISPSWMLPMYLLCSNLGILTVEAIIKRLGLRVTYVLGITLFVSSYFMSYFTVSHSIWALTLTFMMVGGMGNSLAATCGMVYLAGWFGSKMGLATGLHKASSAVGGIAINMILTAYINPQNLSPDTTRGELHLFSQAAVIDRVPNAFIVMGGLCAVVQYSGFLFLKTPRSEPAHGEDTYLLQDTTEVKADNESQSESDLSMEIHSHCHKVFKQPDDTSTSSVICPSISRTHGNMEEIERHNTSSAMAHDNSDSQNLSKRGDGYFTPMQVLKCDIFYVLELAVLALAVGMITVSNYSKHFGLTEIKDDRFLAFVGSSASFCSVVFLLGVGSLVDFIGLKNTFMAQLAVCSVFLVLWYFTVGLSQWLYLFWTMVLYSSYFNQNVLGTVSALKLFGKQHFATNLGLIQIATVIAYLLCPPLLAFVLNNFGWFWMFFTTSCLAFVAMLFISLRMPPL